MKKLLFGLFLLLAAIGIGFLIKQDPGYILVYYHQWSISTSLWVGLLALFILWTVLHYALRLIKHILSIRSTLGHWSHQRRHKKALGHVDKGLCHLLNAEWKKSEDTFRKSKKDSPNPLLNHYFTAMAAQQQGNFESRDNCLKEACELSEQFEIPVLLYKTQLQIDSKQWQEALNTLEHLYQRTPKNVSVLTSLKKVALELQDWPRLEILLPELAKQQCVSKTELDNLYEDVYIAYLQSIDLTKEPELIDSRWKDIPSKYQNNPNILYQYSTILNASSEKEQAITLIENFLRKQWDAQLVALYGTILDSNIPQRILTAEKWLQQHPDDIDLLYSLAQLSIVEKLWTKARDYLLSCQKLSPNTKYLIALASLCELTGEHSEALQYYKSSNIKQ